MSKLLESIDLSIDPFYTLGVLIHFIEEQFRKKGFTNAVLGVSGGVDSALGVALLVEALGARHVTGLSMPAGESNPQSQADAEAVAETFGIELEVVSIRDVVQSFFANERKPNRVRVGNVAARVRMMRLFDWSHAHHALVVGTSNKTELLLGYGTWHGDLASSINPIGDLYKTQIRQLANFIGIPRRVIEKPPSADLWKGQTDEKELGITYDTVDRLLYLMVDCNYSMPALKRSGFAESMVRKVYRMIVNSQFKRSLPIIPKLSAKTIGLDFHLSHDWLT